VEFVKENFLLIGVAVASGLMLLWPLISRKGGQQLDSAEAVMKINREDAVVIDVREDAEVAKGRIPNAKHIPLGQLSSRLAELEKHKGKPIIVACRSGHRSAGACGILTKNGFENVYNLSGGMIAWEQANLPVEK
jgi:rhodanese-related sulfurtransferase